MFRGLDVFLIHADLNGYEEPSSKSNSNGGLGPGASIFPSALLACIRTESRTNDRTNT